MMNENYNTPNSGCCGRPFPTAPENKCNHNDCCMNEYAYKQKACIREKQPDCETQAVIPSITVETVDGITNLANCLVHVTSTNTTYYVDDKHRIMITWAGPVNIPGYDMVNNPRHFKNQIVSDIDQKIAVLYDNNGRGFTFAVDQDADFQQIINEKLNEMVEDGTFTELITPIVGDTIDELSAEVTRQLDDFDDRLDGVESEVEDASYVAKTSDIRKESYNTYKKVTLPTGLSSNLTDMFTLLKNDEGNYYLDFNRDDYVNSGGTTYYMSPDGLDTNDGLTKETAWRTFSKFKNTASAGDTLILTSGFYGKERFNASTAFSLPCNIIGEGDVFVSTQDTSYSWTDETGGVYSTTRSGVAKVYDIQDIKNGKTTEYTNVDTLTEVQNTPLSWTLSGSTLYIHTPNGIEPTNQNTVVGLGTGAPSIYFQEPTQDSKLYIKNITIVDGATGGIVIINNTNYNVNVLIEDVRMFNIRCNTYAYDGMSNRGCNTICNNVEIYNTGKDGFNYHAGTYKQAYGVEYNCKANNFGYGHTSSEKLSNNATTAHNSCEVIRVNGEYSYCNGGVCVDIDTSKGLFYNCVAIDSYGRSYDFYAGGTCDMYVIDCYTKGSRANDNLLTNADSHLYYNEGTLFDTKRGNCILI